MAQVSQNRTVTSVEARAALLRAFKIKQPVFLWGAPGIGKSDLIAKITADMGGHMIDLRMPLLEPTDLRGIPFYNRDNGTMDWAPPIDLPNNELAAKYPIVVLFLDEMNGAANAVQASAYQLILNRKIGRYTLPDNVVMVAAGNRETDKGVTYRMPAPLQNRFVHLEMRHDFASWLDWAVQNNINKDVIGHISFAKQDLYDFDPKGSGRAFATPRSWTFVSRLLDDGIGDSTLMDLVSGTVGDGMAVKFMAHRRLAASMPNPADILAGKVKTMETKEISAMYSLVISMCYELKDALAVTAAGKNKMDWNEMADNFLSFMMANFTTEMVVMAARVALKTYTLPIQPAKSKVFAEFNKRFGKYVHAGSAQ